MLSSDYGPWWLAMTPSLIAGGIANYNTGCMLCLIASMMLESSNPPSGFTARICIKDA
jgi:hypothetical protein